MDRASLIMGGASIALLLAGSPRVAHAQSDPEAAYAGRNIYYGDLHSHTCYSADASQQGWSTPGETPWQALKFARDVAQLDFCCITDHGEQFLFTGGPHSLTGSIPALGPKGSPSWQDEIRAADAFNLEESTAVVGSSAFVTFCGWEWTGGPSLTRQSKDGGYPGFTGHRCVIWNSVKNAKGEYELPSQVTSAYDAATPLALWKALDAFCKDHPAADYITTPHTTAQANIRMDWAFTSSKRQILVEIFSKHGSSEAAGAYLALGHAGGKGFAESGAVKVGLESWSQSGKEGYRLGFIASTDGHNAQPGNVFEGLYVHDADAPKGGHFTVPHGSSGGHAVVFAEKKTRAAIWAGLRARLTYATSGARIRLFVTARTDRCESVRMGQVATATSGTCVTLDMKAYGQKKPIATARDARGENGDFSSAPIESFEIVRDGVLVATVPAKDGVAVSWTDPTPVAERASYYVRALQAPTPTCQCVTNPDNGRPLPREKAALLAERAWSSPIYVTTEKDEDRHD